MKFSKFVVWSALIVFTVAFTACGGGDGGGKYADAKKTMGQFIDAWEQNIADLDKADNAKDFAVGLKSMAKIFENFKGEMEKFEQKYPELKGMDNPPPEMAEEAARLEALGEKMSGIMMKIMQYGEDPDVKAAMEELQKAGIGM
ncbi:MAG: hypothetical protein JW755_00715 [Candidatus Aminicenantes bacterium]|nr:hypothetical protein [Candidatus Aminicenantes bacterium]